ncbi:hypothetical protein A9Q87_09735 [Flavobacteriales bacterium 34_180_T64]|nr:hypothetical protein A9Q87_09735 [Flavobacteriales bacterium 34_180_T64]
MIVNPQLFNYRLISGSLIVAIAVLSVFSFTNYQSVKAHQQFLEQEKQLVETELSQMIMRYDNISANNTTLSEALNTAKRETILTLDSLRILKSDLSVISKFKNQLIVLKSNNKSLFTTIDSLDQTNEALEAEKILAFNAFEEQRDINTSLIEENKLLNASLEKGALLTANSFKAEAFKTILGKQVVTAKAVNAKSIEVCFTLAENSLTETGAKELYIQIVNPQNNVMADKGAMNFGDSSLIYSLKKTVNYNNKVLDLCVNVESDVNDQPLTKGTYFVSVFHEDRKLGDTQVILK